MNADLEAWISHFQTEGWKLISTEESEAHFERPLLRWQYGWWLILTVWYWPFWLWKFAFWARHRIGGNRTIVDHLEITLLDDGDIKRSTRIAAYP